MRWVYEWGSPLTPHPVQRPAGGHGWLLAVASGVGAGVPCSRHPCHNSAGAQPRRYLFLAGKGGGGGGSPGPPGSPGHPVPSPSQVLCQQRWRGLTLPSSGCFADPGPPLSPPLSPCPCAPRAAAPALRPPFSPPKPEGRSRRSPPPLPGPGQRVVPLGLSPESSGWFGWGGVVAVGTPKATR